MVLANVQRFGFFVAVLLSVGQVARAADGPALAEKDLISLIELKIDDAAIVARIQKSGLAFEVGDAAVERLRNAGASDAVLKAVRDTTTARKPAAPGPVVTYQDVLKLLSLSIDEDAILKRLEKSPTTFTLSAEQVAELKKAGASDKLLAAMQGGPKVSSQTAELITDIAVVLDCSGSMKEPTKDGKSKMDVAKAVVADLVRKIPDGLNVTFVIYGHEVYGPADDPRNCQAVKVARPLGPLDAVGKSTLASMIATLKPTGTTPIALALRTAGAELTKSDAYCGIVLISDGKETCQGDPAAEAAKLAQNPKLTFGVNVVGFDVNAEERKSLEEVAAAGKGKYHNAETAGELADSIGTIVAQLQKAAKPPEAVASGRRAVKVVQPTIELLPMKEILLTEAGAPKGTLRSYVKAKVEKYDEEIRIPSGTAKYELWWIPKEGHALRMATDLVFPERKVVSIKPEDYLGLIRVKGTRAVKQVLVVPAGSPKGTRTSYTTQETKKFGDVMIVPVGKYDIWVDENVIEEGLEVTAGKLYELE